MARHVEQLDRHERGGYKRWLKRALRRLMRRLWRKHGDDAPAKPPYRGYSS